MIFSSARAEEIKLFLSESETQQGSVVVIRIEAPHPGSKVRVWRDNKSVPAFPSKDNHLEWVALVPFDLDLLEGEFIVRVVCQMPDRGEVTQERKIFVRKGKFGRRELRLPAYLVNPPESEIPRIRQEREMLREIFEGVSSEWKGSGSFTLPFPGFRGVAFGEERILNGERKSPHSGVDAGAPEGTAVMAINSGEVVYTGYLYYEGNTVILDHGLGVYSVYAHLKEIAVKKGERVAKGEIIGWVGKTGRATNPHLHLGLKIMNERVDPNKLLNLSLD